MAYDPARQRVVLFGGDLLGSTFVADTWEWDGEFWTQVADTGPSPRSGHRLAFDSHAAAIVLFGGGSAGGQLHGDTWQWDGSDWTQVADTGPSARSGHAVAYDTGRSRLVLFGGEGAGSALQRDTWEWDGTAWTQVEDVGPSARRHHAMGFDSDRARTVLFGGDVGAESAADTWEWDGTSWVQVADIGPAACAAAAMAFNGSAMLLFGGVASVVPAAFSPPVSGFTWEWDGEHWTLRQDMGPHPRWGHALAFDSNRSKVVLFGGLRVGSIAAATPTDLLADTWDASPAAGAAVEIASFRLEPDTVPSGGSTEMIVELAEPAPAGGALVALSVGGTPLATIGITAGTTTGQTSFVVPGGAAPGDVEFEARVGASARTAVLHVVGIATALVSFTLTPDTITEAAGGLVAFDVALDQPAPAGGVLVDVTYTGSPVLAIPVAAGSTSGHDQIDFPAGNPPGDYPLDAQLAGTVITAVLHNV